MLWQQLQKLRSDCSILFGELQIDDNWASSDELNELLEIAEKAIQRKQNEHELFLKELGNVLRNGEVEHHLASRRARLNELRVVAAEELDSAAGSSALGDTPVAACEWLNWFWNTCEDPETIVSGVEASLPKFANFLSEVTASQWLSLVASDEGKREPSKVKSTAGTYSVEDVGKPDADVSLLKHHSIEEEGCEERERQTHQAMSNAQSVTQAEHDEDTGEAETKAENGQSRGSTTNAPAKGDLPGGVSLLGDLLMENLHRAESEASRVTQAAPSIDVESLMKATIDTTVAKSKKKLFTRNSSDVLDPLEKKLHSSRVGEDTPYSPTIDPESAISEVFDDYDDKVPSETPGETTLSEDVGGEAAALEVSDQEEVDCSDAAPSKAPVLEAACDRIVFDRISSDQRDDEVQIARDAATNRDDMVPPVDAECELDSEPLATEVAVDSAMPALEADSMEDRPVAIPLLDPELRSFEKFRQQYWVSPTGRCDVAPWRQAGFVDVLKDRMFAALADEQFGHAAIFSEALIELGNTSSLSPEFVLSWGKHWRRRSDVIPAGERVVNWLREQRDAGRSTDRAALQLMLTMLALHPSTSLPPSRDEITTWLNEAQFSNGTLSAFLQLSFDLEPQMYEPLLEMQKAVQHVAEDQNRKDIEEFTKSRGELRSEVRRVWSACGGDLKQKHSRAAWRDFMEMIQPTLDRMYPSGAAEIVSWDCTATGKALQKYVNEYRILANKRDVQKRDRGIMDRTSREILELAFKVNDLARRIQMSKKNVASDKVPVDRIRDRLKALQQEDISTPLSEDLSRRLILRSIERQSETGQLHIGLSARDFLRSPGLLGCLREPIVKDIRQVADDKALVTVDEVVDSLRAAAVLLSHPETTSRCGTDFESESLTFDQMVRAQLAQSRFDLLAPLLRNLSTEDQNRVRTLRNENFFSCLTERRSLERLRDQLGDLAGSNTILTEMVNHATEVFQGIQERGTDTGTSEILFANWLIRLREFAETLLSASLDQFRRAVENSDNANKPLILAALETGRLADAVYLKTQQPDELIARRMNMRLRHTPWRKEALERFPSPRDTIHAFCHGDSERRARAYLKEFGDYWMTGLTGSAVSDQKLRNRFADVIFNFFGDGPSDLRKRASLDTNRVSLSCELIRSHLNAQGLNPCFVPQLASGDLVVLSLPGLLNDPALEEKTAALAASYASENTVVLLAPGISSAGRIRLLREILSRQCPKPVAVIDDIDICRLLNPGGQQGNLLIGLMEIILEQQRWALVSPFHAHDGTHARIEMYVGRNTEAKILALNNRYSRLFSGRRLGKSALLRYVEQTYDRHRLPSGNELRVLRTSIVGNEADATVIEKIMAEVRTRLNYDFEKPDEYTADSLIKMFNSLLAERPALSLLIILDEADIFVERQLEDFLLRQEKCLSFRMRSDIQRTCDSSDLPRIRFVFAGYRKTHSYNGAWGNWGDVLRLAPLAAQEAEMLIAGPLARLGIDASEVAHSIAFRCGYQPAVILRFGEELLSMLDKTRCADIATRDHVMVTAEEVAAIYQKNEVQQEIRSVNRNNFQSNDLGQLIFSAMLKAFADLHPGDELINAPSAIWARIKSYFETWGEVSRGASAAIPWLPSVSTLSSGVDTIDGPSESGLSEINRHLMDFVERELLNDVVSPEDCSFRLKFPYHLSTLLVQVESEAKDATIRLGKSTSTKLSGESNRNPDPLPAATMLDLEIVLRRYEDLGFGAFEAAVVCSHWVASISHADWLANRFGLDPNHVCRDQYLNHSKAQSFIGIKSEVANQLLTSSRSSGAGTSLKPRLLIGTTDLLRWSLAEAHNGRLLEIKGQRRVSRDAVVHWFSVVRAFTFEQDLAEEIHELTKGIPFLLNLFDSVLRSELGTREGGVDVGQTEFAKALRAYHEQLPEAVRSLRDETNPGRLDSRERELLMMCVAVATSGGTGQVTISDLAEYWEEQLYQPLPGWPKTDPFRDSRKDRQSLQILGELGLLPEPFDMSTTSKGPVISATDPLVTDILPGLIGQRGQK